MGKPVWLLLPMAADWRWLTERADTPWYPDMRLFRQSVAGDWQGVMERVAASLHRYGRTVPATSPARISPESDVASPLREERARRGQPADATARPAALRIGLAWWGNQNNPKRSCPLTTFAPLARSGHATFYSLQVVDGLEQAADPPPGMALKDLSGQIHDFEDTTALIANLDLVISIDTSIAHLAGAMGTPTWLLLPYAADWRWMMGRDDSPWYPAMHLFRQSEPGDWPGVIAAVADALSALASGAMAVPLLPGRRHADPTRSQERAALEQTLARHQAELARNPSSPDAYLDVGAALALLGKHREAVPHYRRALELAPEHVQAHLNLGFSLLALGEFAEGWCHHEWRHRKLESALPAWPLLRRSDLDRHREGAALLVHCEQGYGDTIQFIRFAPLLADLGFRVVVTCQPELAPLVSTVRGVSRVVPHGEMLPVCDLQVLLLTLPLLFDTTPETMAHMAPPYLAPRPEKLVRWRRLL